MATETMATLTGTEKQVAWAEEIRARALAQLAAGDATLGDHPELPEIVAWHAVNAEVGRRLRAEASAAWWIEHRSCGDMDWDEVLGLDLAAFGVPA